MSRELSGAQSPSGRFGEMRNLLSMPGFELRSRVCPGRELVIIRYRGQPFRRLSIVEYKSMVWILTDLSCNSQPLFPLLVHYVQHTSVLRVFAFHNPSYLEAQAGGVPECALGL